MDVGRKKCFSPNRMAYLDGEETVAVLTPRSLGSHPSNSLRVLFMLGEEELDKEVRKVVFLVPFLLLLLFNPSL